MSIASRRIQHISMYSNITIAMPETMAEKINTTGIRGEDHHGFALTDPKIKPTYPCSRNAEGMPMTVISQPTRSSICSDRSLMLVEPSVSVRYNGRFQPLADWDMTTMSR